MDKIGQEKEMKEMEKVKIKEEPVDDSYNSSIICESHLNKSVESIYIKTENEDNISEETSQMQINEDSIKIEPRCCEPNDKEIAIKEEPGNSDQENESGILRKLLSKETATAEMEDRETSEVDQEVEEPIIPQKFKVNMSAIESVSKENQASELQGLDGLSVYDQGTLEAGILQQVDEALEQELEPQETPGAAVLELEQGMDETEMQKMIRLGEMTPFGSTMNQAATNQIKPIDGLSEIEKYFQKQLKLQGKRTKKLSDKKLTKNKNAHNKFKLEKKHKKFKEGHKNKKRKIDDLDLEEDDLMTSSEPEQLNKSVEERVHEYVENASGSEYVPSESDHSSGDESSKKREVVEQKQRIKSKKRKASLSSKSYKIPEDWASDDSDWEYSDEEGNLSKKKRSKKELDDGDVDTFNRRIKLWERERRSSGPGKENQAYHKLGDGYKLPKDMWDKLFNYQKVGVRWLWELDQQRCGGILGDEMGLGKTIQVIAFLAGLHVSQMKDRDTNYRGLGPTLIICPTTVMHQWVRELHTWYPPLRVAILHESGTFTGKQRGRLIGNIVHSEGILITSYTGAIQHKEEIITRRWHYIILDEGHKIRNPDAQVTLMVKQVRTTHRIILSGSPMQNNLKELWSLFDFVFPGKLGTLPVFMEQFAVPITQGGYANASQVQVMAAFKCATILKDSIAPYLLRRMKSDVKSHVNLPEKNEQVLFCRLTEKQRDLYKGYVESSEVSRILEGRLKIFMGLINLRKICNHPDLYSGGPKLYPGDQEEDLPENERYGHWCKSGKMIVVETLLKLWKKQNHRVLIFTQSRQMLSIMEMFVRQSGYSYLKLDGGTSIAARQPLINKFNQDMSYFVMLLTTRVGGLGVNLTGANRVVIYDPDWNPATDTQARERAWRIGQKQTVTVYRLITAGTIEEKMYHRQIFKQFLCNKVLKDPRQRRFFKSNDLYELFTLKETDVEGSTETAAIFAGTGSEVKLDPTKKYKHRRVEPRLEAKPPAETFSRKKAEKLKKSEGKRKENLTTKNENGLEFSDEKIECMKKLAHILSQKMLKKSSPEKSESEGDNKVVDETQNDSSYDKDKTIEIGQTESTCTTNKVDLNQPSTSEVKEMPGCSYTYQNSDFNCVIESSSLTSSKEEKHRKHKERHRDKDKKKRHHKDGKFEGERVPHLVKTRVATSQRIEEEEQEKTYATQDEYVLQKLFAKSGLQTALKHDTIMEGGPADYAIVEGEADRVAKQAVEKLKESRRECWRPTSGVPTFTGLNGARNFQPKKQPGVVESLSSSQLLNMIKKRNGITDAKDVDLELVDDVRHFVSSQGGTVTTDQLIARFNRGLKEESSPLFKSLLGKICTFYRAPDKIGYWTLKQEFNW